MTRGAAPRRPYRAAVLAVVLIGALVVIAGLALAAAVSVWAGWWVLVAALAVLLAVAIYDLVQRRHAVLRNYPLLGHLRYLLESVRPELQQYFIERNFDGRPYDRDTRTLIYERAKGTAGERRSAPSGT